jgi:hypothetical protein
MVLTWKNAGGNVCVAPGPEAADHGNVNFARSVHGGLDMVTEPGFRASHMLERNKHCHRLAQGLAPERVSLEEYNPRMLGLPRESWRLPSSKPVPYCCRAHCSSDRHALLSHVEGVFSPVIQVTLWAPPRATTGTKTVGHGASTLFQPPGSAFIVRAVLRCSRRATPT